MRVTKTVLTNMCMICNGDFILVQDKVNSSYTGVTFPGGHVEHGETLADAMIREVKEELAHGMDKVYEIAMNGEYTECFCNLETRRETLY